MDLRHFRYFVAVAEEGHLTRAAARLHIQQPPLSMQIRALETELGATLFKRSARGMELTQAGAAFLSDVRAILAAVDQAARRARDVSRGLQGRLALGFTTSAILHPIVPQIVRTFRATYPGVELELHEDNAAALTEKLVTRKLAAAILRSPVSRPAELAFEELLREEMLVVLPMDHPLGRKTRPLRLRELDGEPLILVRQSGAPGLYSDVLAACRAAGFSPKIAAEVPHMLTNVNLVAAGAGISLVPESVSKVYAQHVRYCRLVGRPALVAPLTLAYVVGEPDPSLANLREIVAIVGRPPAPSPRTRCP